MYQNKHSVLEHIVGTKMCSWYHIQLVTIIHMKFKLLIIKQHKNTQIKQSFTLKKIQEFVGIKAMVGKMVNDR